MTFRRPYLLVFALLTPSLGVVPASAQSDSPPAKSAPAASRKKQARSSSPADELQKTIDAAGNDRAALVRNLEAYLQTYPEAPQRPQIYRALVEACLQLRDVPRAAGYAERIVALTPNDMSMTLLAIQLLERSGDEAALRRALSYSSRVLEYVRNSSIGEKSPRVSPEEWEKERKRDQMNVLLLRGRLETKLHDSAAARNSYSDSYALLPNAAAALHVGEIDELASDYSGAATQYARAFVLSDPANHATDRLEIRRKLGNVWRLAHGSDAGLGDLLLHTYDELSATPAPNAAASRAARGPYDLVLRSAPSGPPVALEAFKGQVLVVNFWATWCGPCRALEPLYDRVAAQFREQHDVHFLAADCDEDESLVPAYLDEVKPKTKVVFSDGLDSLFAIDSYPTVIVLDRSGKIAFRSSGFGDDRFEQELSSAIQVALGAPSPSRPASAQPAPSGPTGR